MKTPKNIAVIDLGSNTFHILIVDPNGGKEVYRERVFVSLAEEGIQRIGDAAFERGIHTLDYFAHLLIKHHVNLHRIVGTAALRAACNAKEFILQVKKKTGLNVEVIDGTEEAAYITQGIQSIIPMSEGTYLIMDIGGGSVEFILMEDGDMVLVRSYNIGIGQLYNQITHEHPIDSAAQNTIRTFILDAISDISAVIQNKSITALVGASGSFEILESLEHFKSKTEDYNVISSDRALKHLQNIYNSTYGELLTNEAIPRSRAKLIVLAFLLIDVVLQLSKTQEIYVSPAAMKEGILSELLASYSNA